MLMGNRCMHELKTLEVDRVAQKMDTEEQDGSKSICVTELGESVLTLQEVVQTFKVNSPMYNIKLGGCCRTVVLKKNHVVIDGETKLIIMINDVTEKVRFE